MSLIGYLPTPGAIVSIAILTISVEWDYHRECGTVTQIQERNKYRFQTVPFPSRMSPESRRFDGRLFGLDRISGSLQRGKDLLNMVGSAGFQFQLDATDIDGQFQETPIMVDLQHVGLVFGDET